MPDTRLGPYELVEEIGRGGMATVYRAYQPAMGRYVAVKIIHKSIAEDAQALERFRREARIIARLEHPHILPVYDFDGAHDPPYIVMRYMDSGTLKDVLRQRRLTFDEVIHLLRQIAAALDYAHRQGVVHRDVKPSNIMLDRDGNVIVSDFGIARVTVEADQESTLSGSSHLTKSGALMGTPDYMSPEQIRGDAVDGRADVYALGAMTFEMLTGRLPFQDRAPAMVLLRHLQDTAPHASSLNPDLPPESDAVLARAMAKPVEARYPSAGEFTVELVRALGGATSAAPPHLRAAIQSALAEPAPTGLTRPATSTRTPSEQNKMVSVLHADAGEYAEWTEDISGVEAARHAIQAMWARARSIVEEFGGQTLTCSQDTLLALWGAETAHESDAEHAVRAGLALLAITQEASGAAIEPAQAARPRLKIGVSTGMALLSPDPAAPGYTARGPAVRLAGRLAQQSSGSVLIAPDTYRAVCGVFDIELDSPLRMRERQEVVTVYRVLTAKPRSFRLEQHGVEGIQVDMIGREPELKQLQDAFFAAVEERETQVVTVTGAAGLGKSRLLYEFINWAELRPEVYRFFRGRAAPATCQPHPYTLLRDVLSFRFKIYDNDDPAVVRDKLSQGIAELIPVTTPEIAHLIGYLVGFDLTGSPYTEPLLSDPAELAARARAAFMRLFITLCSQEPALIELEDLHHADKASLDLFSELARAHRNLSLLVVCAARPSLYDLDPSWGGGRADVRIELRPLSKREGRTLVRNLLHKVESLPAALIELIVERSEGNPYYVEELIKMLIEDHIIQKGVKADSPWSVAETRLDAWREAIPTTLVGLLQARLDSLLQPERVALQRAAVLGRMFWDSAVQALAAGDGITFPTVDVLGQLAEREFIYARETSAFEGSREYVFAQGLLRDVVYESMVKRQRRAYHAAAAEWLIAAAGQRVDEYAMTIAGHYEQAEQNKLAIEYLLRAGDRARLAYAHQEAADYYRRALGFLEQHEQDDLAARTWMKLGLTYQTAFDFQQSQRAYEQGFALWQRAAEAPAEKHPPAPHAHREIWAVPITLDPNMAVDAQSATTAAQLFSGLVELSAELNVSPDVASHWDVQDNGRRFVFYLRDDVRWSDGVKVSAHDFEYAWKRTLHPATASPNASSLYDIRGAAAFHQGQGPVEDVGVRALDDFTLEVKLQEPVGYFLHLLTHTATFPVPRHVVERYGPAWSEPAHIVTNGPFLLAAWQPEQAITLVRNPAYHGQFIGNLEQVELYLRPLDPCASLEMYKANELDVLNLVNFSRPDVTRALQEHAGEYFSAPRLQTEYVGFNLSHSPFDNIRVRQAFAMAIDRYAVANAVMPGNVAPATGGFVPYAMPGHSPGIAFPYDPDRARRLLAEAGYPGGRGLPPLEVLHLYNSEGERYIECLLSQWQNNLGIVAAHTPVSWADYMERITHHPPAIFLSAWIADYPDPDNFLRVGVWCNSLDWHNAAYKTLVEQARQVADQAERMALYRQADKLLIEECALLPLYYAHTHVLIKPWVRAYPMPTLGMTLHAKGIIIEPR